MDRLFVYGTLRPGSKNEYAEQLAKAAYHLGSATVSGRLYRVTHYPALVAAQSKDERVKGDLFQGVTAELLMQLDEYEGAQYAREIMAVTMEGGQVLRAYGYRYVEPTTHLELIQSGDWRENDF